jgi:hypothetical protein
MIFLYVILTILHNIGLYIYIVRYRSNIKILSFPRNISKKNLKLKKKSQFFKINFLLKKQKYFVFMHMPES